MNDCTPIQFPSNPAVGDVYLGWMWDGQKWVTVPPAGGGEGGLEFVYTDGVTIFGDGSQANPLYTAAFLLLAGGTMTGPLTLSGPPTQALQAANKDYVDQQINGLGQFFLLLRGGTMNAVDGTNGIGISISTILDGAQDQAAIRVFTNTSWGSGIYVQSASWGNGVWAQCNAPNATGFGTNGAVLSQMLHVLGDSTLEGNLSVQNGATIALPLASLWSQVNVFSAVPGTAVGNETGNATVHFAVAGQLTSGTFSRADWYLGLHNDDSFILSLDGGLGDLAMRIERSDKSVAFFGPVNIDSSSLNVDGALSVAGAATVGGDLIAGGISVASLDARLTAIGA